MAERLKHAPPAVPELETSTSPTGPAAAAALAAGIGLLAVGGTNLVMAVYQPFEQGLLTAGSLFIPGGVHLAAYSGKELVGLVTWLGSWMLLHWRLRYRQVDLTAAAAVFLTCLITATLLFWPPAVHALARFAR